MTAAGGENRVWQFGWILLAATLFTSTQPSTGAVFVTDAPAFVVASDADDDITIDCTAGKVRVFDDGAPTTYTTSCSAISSMTVNGGLGDNTITLSGITAVAFSGLPQVTVLSSGGFDSVNGSGLPDHISGGDADDQISGGPGNDVITWNPGDDDDVVTGDDGADTLIFNGGGGSETYTIVPEGTGFDLNRVTPAPVAIDAEAVESLELNTAGGDDNLTTEPLPFTSQHLDGGLQASSDSLSVMFGGNCFLVESAGFIALGFGPITFANFETASVLGGGDCTIADIDGDGSVEPLTDGLLELRYAFGFRGTVLTTGAVGSGCMRCTAPEIEAYLNGLH